MRNVKFIVGKFVSEIHYQFSDEFHNSRVDKLFIFEKVKPQTQIENQIRIQVGNQIEINV